MRPSEEIRALAGSRSHLDYRTVSERLHRLADEAEALEAERDEARRQLALEERQHKAEATRLRANALTPEQARRIQDVLEEADVNDAEHSKVEQDSLAALDRIADQGGQDG